MKKKQEKHSVIGGSSCERWWNCPASVKAEQTQPAQESSIYSVEGTVAHDLAAEALLKGMGVVSRKEGNLIEKDGFEIEVTEEMIAAIDTYSKKIFSDMSQLGLSGDDLLVEHRLHLSHIHPKAFGTADAVLIEPFGLMKVYDFKYGKGISVDAYKNEQCIFYAVGAAAGNDPDEIEMVIVQPRAHHEAGPIREWRIPISYLKDFEEELKVKAHDPFKKDPKFSAGDWCRFCRFKPVCPEQKKQVQEIAKIDFEGNANPINPEVLDSYDISRILKKKKLIEDWLKDVEKRAINLVESGDEIHGFKLIKKYGNRAWINEDEIVSEFEDLYGEEIYNKKLKSPAQLEKVIGKGVIDDYVEKPERGVVLVPNSAKGEPVKRSAIEDFS